MMMMMMLITPTYADYFFKQKNKTGYIFMLTINKTFLINHQEQSS